MRNDYVPDEYSEYDETNIKFEKFIKGMKVTHRWCPETRQMQSLEFFKKKLDKEIEIMYTQLGGES